MNQLHLGNFNKQIQPNGGYLCIDDEGDTDITQFSFNPLMGINYRKARDIAAIVYAISPQGENTLTVRNGRRALVKLLLKAKRLDRLPPPHGDAEIEAHGMIDDLLVSPILRNVLCRPTTLWLKKSKQWNIGINRAELGEFDSLVLGLFLIGQFQGQIVIPDFGFYGRDLHLDLLRQERLISGISFLAEISLKLQRAVLLIKDISIRHANYDDAVTVAKQSGLAEGTVEFSAFVNEALQ